MPFTIRPYRRFHVQSLTLITIAALLMLHTPSHAGFCLPPVVEKESPYHYLLALTDSLAYAKTATERYSEERTESTQEHLLNLFLSFKLAKADFDCAASQVSPYGTSTDRVIKASAEAAALSFFQLAELTEQAALDWKSTLDSGPKEFKQGTFLERQAEHAASIDDAWKQLLQASIMANYSVVEKDPSTGLMSRLALTAKQRDKILQMLRSTFGEEVTKGMKAGEIPLVVAASALYEVIGNQPRKTRDNK